MIGVLFHLLEENAVDAREIGDLSEDDPPETGSDPDAGDQGSAILVRKEVLHMLNLYTRKRLRYFIGVLCFMRKRYCNPIRECCLICFTAHLELGTS